MLLLSNNISLYSLHESRQSQELTHVYVQHIFEDMLSNSDTNDALMP